MDVTPEAQGGLIGVAITAGLSLAGIWLKGRFSDRADERQTLLAAYQGMQRAWERSEARVAELTEKVWQLERAVDQANQLSVAAGAENELLRQQAIEATEERDRMQAEIAELRPLRAEVETLRRLLWEHEIECPGHGDGPAPRANPSSSC